MFQVIFIVASLIVTLVTVLVILSLLNKDDDKDISAVIRTPLLSLTISSSQKDRKNIKRKNKNHKKRW